MKFVNKTTGRLNVAIRKSGNFVTSGVVAPNTVYEYRMGQAPVVSGNPAVYRIEVARLDEETLAVTDDTTVTFVTEIRTGLLS
jgi:hypothetical protein